MAGKTKSKTVKIRIRTYTSETIEEMRTQIRISSAIYKTSDKKVLN